MPNSSRRGQSLIELLVGITIGVLFITAALGLISVSLRIDFQNKFSQTAAELSQELIEQLTTYANSDWHAIDSLARSTDYSFSPNGSGWFTVPSLGSTVITPNAGDVDYNVSFTVEDVYRTSLTDDTISVSGILDPSIIKVVAKTEWQQSGSTENLTLSKYLSRTQNRIWQQTDWSGTVEPTAVYQSSDYPGGANGNHVATETNIWRGATLDAEDVPPGQLKIQDLSANLRTVPGTGIDTTEPNHWAWNDVAGWINFAYPNPFPVVISPTLISGVVSSNVGEIALDCSRSPAGDICSGPAGNFGVSRDGSNILHGFAWSPSVGWISFNSDNCDTNGNGFTEAICGGDDISTPAPVYGVSLSGSGAGASFSGWAWNDIIGWISFNCQNPGTNGCTSPGVSYVVKTQSGIPSVSVGEVVSPTFDTGQVNGAAYNTIAWLGDNSSGGSVQFKIATSNCSNGADNYPTCDNGTWNFVGPDSPNPESYYEPAGPGAQAKITRADHNNKRYLRYTIYLLSDDTLANSPVVDDVIINWSR